MALREAGQELWALEPQVRFESRCRFGLRVLFSIQHVRLSQILGIAQDTYVGDEVLAHRR